MADNDDLDLTPEDADAPSADAGDADAGSPDMEESAQAPDDPAAQELPDPLDQEDIDAVLAQAENAASQLAGEALAEPPEDPLAGDEMNPHPMADSPFDDAGIGAVAPQIPTFDTEGVDPAVAGKIDLLNDVQLHVKIELGRSRMLVEDVLKLGDGSVVELDKLAGDPVDVYVNERLVARGEVLVLSDNFCVRISEIVSEIETEAPVEA